MRAGDRSRTIGKGTGNGEVGHGLYQGSVAVFRGCGGLSWSLLVLLLRHEEGFRARFKKELGFDGARKGKAELTLGNWKGGIRDGG